MRAAQSAVHSFAGAPGGRLSPSYGSVEEGRLIRINRKSHLAQSRREKILTIQEAVKGVYHGNRKIHILAGWLDVDRIS